MRKIEKLDKYILSPNVRFYGGFTYDGKDIFLCDDLDEDEGYKFHVVQKIENNIMITDLERDIVTEKGRTIKEKTHLEVQVHEGEKIIYIEGTGYTIPESNICKIEEAIELFKIIENKPKEVEKE